MITKYSLYNGSVDLMFNGLRHQYTVDGKEIPSVTSILSILAKPALIFWSANTAVEYISEQIKAGVSYDEVQLESIWQVGKKVHTQKKTDAGSIGSITHKWVEKYITGQQPAIPINEGIRLSVMKFMEWEAKNNVKFLCSEQPIYSKKNKYSGTLDFICQKNGKLYIGDLKTSSGIWDEYKLQAVAYMQARQEEYLSENYAGILIVRIGKDGEFEFFEEEDPEKIKLWQRGFNSLVKVKEVMDSFKKNV